MAKPSVLEMCPVCGKPNFDRGRTCFACGAKLTQPDGDKKPKPPRPSPNPKP